MHPNIDSSTVKGVPFLNARHAEQAVVLSRGESLAALSYRLRT